MAKSYSEITAKYQAQSGLVPLTCFEHNIRKTKWITVAEAEKRGLIHKPEKK